MNNENKQLVGATVIFSIGVISRLYAASQSYVDSSGILHDSIWLPLSSILLVLGLLMLIGVGVKRGLKRD